MARPSGKRRCQKIRQIQLRSVGVFCLIDHVLPSRILALPSFKEAPCLSRPPTSKLSLRRASGMDSPRPTFPGLPRVRGGRVSTPFGGS